MTTSLDIQLHSLEGEKWADVHGYEGLYMISTKGRVISLPRLISRKGGGILKYPFRFRKTPLNGSGYPSVKLSINTKYETVTVHRMIMEAFVPNPLGKPCINHIDGIRANSILENLEWVTHSENSYHDVFVLGHKRPSGMNHGSYTKPESRRHGELNGRAILKQNQINEIRAEYETGQYTKYDLARKYGLGYSSMSRLLLGRSWKSVPR